MIYILGSKGFLGTTIFNGFQDQEKIAGIDRENYNQWLSKPCEVFINANGNSKKYLAEKNPVADFDLSVKSTIRSIFDFPSDLYLYISTVDVYSHFTDDTQTREDAHIQNNLQSFYGFHKWLSEQYVINRSRKHWLIIRLGGLVGPGLTKGPVYDVIHDVPLKVHPDSRYQYVHTNHVVKAIKTILDKGITNEIINICGTGTISLKRIYEWLGKDVQDGYGKEIQHYEINNSKINAMFNVPSTTDSVKMFLKESGLI